MELSKEQMKLLKQVKENSINTDPDYYYNNQILQDLMYKDELILATMEWDDNKETLYPTSYVLTVDGKNELSKAIEKRKNHWKDKILYPIITGTVTGVIGYLLGKFG
ncbi:hypothetical protein [Companilactobacillus bobalius]|uniref:Uncharacterized protein n=3 Tax=Companilactobacillus TaxID=2767879 RepID=A0A202F5P8_9LACO|nr:hypothetical protein [Companilactobacillus bobalius]GEO59330.1 hypothetical protein LBO01_24590 [Companilactobacillus paralimentarius]HIY92382.1 hypothetical protein [Candidatus Companilactobacillus pullicola]KAE9560686.1 hypothetical protein ATN92_11160 [Companilactobacillus bobalius]KRK85028.1 hypothetical protein FC78_GL000829 [Companilactobacillus bobalius DSM 19674]OVE95816.1 hypothetical protein LKACC16343_02568 [Companilactobacillus bobalius]